MMKNEFNSDAKFCALCGATLIKILPENDHRERLACSKCHQVAYENPKILVSCIASWQEKVLWMKRATEPQKGYWAQPSGFMEQGETPEQAAARELYEETGAIIAPDRLHLFVVGSLPEISEVYLVYRAELTDQNFGPSDEAEQVALYAEEDAPWSEFAYPDVVEALRQFYIDHAQRNYGVYSGCYVNGKNTFTRIS